MLEDALFESQRRKKTRNPITVAVSVGAHAVTIAVLVLIPLLQTQALTLPPIDVSLLLPRIENSRPPIEVFAAQPSARPHTSSGPDSLTTPPVIPTRTIIVDEPPRTDLPVVPSGAGTGLGSLLEKVSAEAGGVAEPLPPPPSAAPVLPPPPPVSPVKVIRQSGGVQAGKLIYQVKPVYPYLARQIRLQGVVVLEAVIGKEGTIDTLRVITGHPFLTQAAMDAVKQWRYQPTLLGGDPVDVITTVTVTFTLQ